MEKSAPEVLSYKIWILDIKFKKNGSLKYRFLMERVNMSAEFTFTLNIVILGI